MTPKIPNFKNKLVGAITFLVLIPVLSLTIKAQALADIDNSPFKDNILNLQADGVISGFADGNFYPHRTVSRGEIAKFVQKGFDLKADTSCKKFVDVGKDNTFFVEITTLKCLGIISGFADGTFGPDQKVNRGQAVKFIIGAAELKDPKVFPNWYTQNPFKDVPEDSPFLEQILRAASHQVVKGFADKTFGLEKEITRGEISKIIDKARSLQNNPKKTLIRQTTGVKAYQVTNHYLQEIDLKEGGDIVFLNGKIEEEGRGRGVYGGDSPSYQRQNIQDIWQRAKSAEPKTFSVNNSIFFNDEQQDFTQLAFLVRFNGQFISDGYAGTNEFLNQKKVLEVWSNQAKISDFEDQDPYSKITAPNAVVALSKKANKQSAKNLGRVFVGVKDKDGDGITETVLILSSKMASQGLMVEILDYFEAEDVLMLDGGNSTQLVIEGQTYINSSRNIPASMVVLGG